MRGRQQGHRLCQRAPAALARRADARSRHGCGGPRNQRRLAPHPRVCLPPLARPHHPLRPAARAAGPRGACSTCRRSFSSAARRATGWRAAAGSACWCTQTRRCRRPASWYTSFPHTRACRVAAAGAGGGGGSRSKRAPASSRRTTTGAISNAQQQHQHCHQQHHRQQQQQAFHFPILRAAPLSPAPQATRPPNHTHTHTRRAPAVSRTTRRPPST